MVLEVLEDMEDLEVLGLTEGRWLKSSDNTDELFLFTFYSVLFW